jgi:DNA-directed RNA polymerase sigma subunit (sigma70/sigma32)
MTREYTVNPATAAARRQRRVNALKRYREINKTLRPGQRGAFAELGRELGLSRERARQLVREGEAME